MSLKNAFRNSYLLIFSLVLFMGLLSIADRLYLKRNDGFCIRNIYSNIKNRTEWQMPSLSSDQKNTLAQILNQPFMYLAKGHQSYVFVSEDQKYVIKFYRFPSHLRPFPYLNHPISYALGCRRCQIKEYNLKKLDTTFQSYRLAFENLKEETGLVFVHLNKTRELNRQLTIVDQLEASYSVDLDQVAFVIQRKAEPFFPTLGKLCKEGKGEMAVRQVVEFITTQCQKGIVNQDAILEKNYGWLDGKPINIDIGRFAKESQISSKQEVAKVTQSLKSYLQNTYPQFVGSYQQQVDRLPN